MEKEWRWVIIKYFLFLKIVKDHRKIPKFIKILADIYPCSSCGVEFRKIIRKNHVDVSSPDNFRRYLCRIHNIVNYKLGKPLYKCK